MTSAGRAIEALERGDVVVLPTDTVYGLVARADRETAVKALYAAKGRETGQPTALLASSVARVVELVPELDERARLLLEVLLPARLTLVLANPAERYPWLGGDRPGTLGIRVPLLDDPSREILAAVGAVAATSANLPGEPECRSVADLPAELVERVACVVDGGRLAGAPSTVVDLTGAEARVLREGAVASGDVLARIEATLTAS